MNRTTRTSRATFLPLATRAMEMVSSNAVVGLSRGEHASEVARMLSRRCGRGGWKTSPRPDGTLAAKECAVCGLEMRTIDEVKGRCDVAQPSECAVLTIRKRTLASVLKNGRRNRRERMKLTMRKSARVVLLKELFVDKIEVDTDRRRRGGLGGTRRELDDCFWATRGVATRRDVRQSERWEESVRQRGRVAHAVGPEI